MSAISLDGVAAAATVLAGVAERAATFTGHMGRAPGLGTILVGDDGPSAGYVRKKHEACAETGLASFHAHLPVTATQADVMAQIAAFNADPAVDAYIVQLPLPKGLDEEAALLAVDPDKDADGLHPVNLGRLVMGADGPTSCTPAGIVEMLVGCECETRRCPVDERERIPDVRSRRSHEVAAGLSAPQPSETSSNSAAISIRGATIAPSLAPAAARQAGGRAPTLAMP